MIKTYCARKGLSRSVKGAPKEPPVGTEVFRSSYWFVKVTMDKKIKNVKRYKRKHLLLWENVHGKIPKNHFIIFLDGNHKNCTLENLCMVSKAVHTRMAQKRLYSNDPEVTKKNIAECRAIKPGPKKGKVSIFSPEIKSYIKNNCTAAGSFSELTRLINYNFGTSYTRKQIKDQGCKQGFKLNLERGKGATVAVGAEWVSPSGYIYVKVSATGTWKERWKKKHCLIWEAANGEVPEGKYIIFLDGNRQNCALENLALVNMAEHLCLLRCGLRFTDPEFTKTGIAIARHRTAIASLVKKRKEMKEGL
jgi:hypothetical protein